MKKPGELTWEGVLKGHAIWPIADSHADGHSVGVPRGDVLVQVRGLHNLGLHQLFLAPDADIVTLQHQIKPQTMLKPLPTLLTHFGVQALPV